MKKKVDVLNASELTELKKLFNGKKVVFTTGTFDGMTDDHLNYLRRVKNTGDILIVGIHSNKFTESINGKFIYPEVSENQRLEAVAGVPEVDYVVMLQNQLDVEFTVPQFCIDAWVVSSNKGTTEFKVARSFCSSRGILIKSINELPELQLA